MYELSRAAADKDRMMLNARVLQMMINATRQVTTIVTRTAFIGTPLFGRTFERNVWHGNALSRENDHICLELVVTALTAQKKYRMIIKQRNTIVAALDWVILWISATQGWPVDDFSRSLMLPRLIMKVTVVLNPRA